MLNGRTAINEPYVVNEEFDGEFVVLNLANGTYYSFKDSGNLLWKAVLDGVAPAEMLAAMERAGNPNAPSARAFFESLVTLELIRPDPAAAAPVDAGLAAGLASLPAVPEIEIYKDLADLILADPVHDVDEQVGWPAPKPAG